MIHKPVLLNKILENLDPQEDEVVLDATLGAGGHSKEILNKIEKGVLIAIDQDVTATDNLASSLGAKLLERCILINGNFRDLKVLLKEKGITKVDKILFDLGMSSDELEHSGRGFSFQLDEPLLMTFKKDPGIDDLTAYKIVNSWNEKDLADIIYEYGDERFSRQIAKKIYVSRKKESIKTSAQLAKIVESAFPESRRGGRIHKATKTFQALRIAVNDELEALKDGLEAGWEILGKEGRMAVISFHSLEDRIVKTFFKEKAKEKKGELLTKKPIVPTWSEIKENPRSRSAKLRVIKKL